MTSEGGEQHGLSPRVLRPRLVVIGGEQFRVVDSVQVRQIVTENMLAGALDRQACLDAIAEYMAESIMGTVRRGTGLEISTADVVTNVARSDGVRDCWVVTARWVPHMVKLVGGLYDGSVEQGPNVSPSTRLEPKLTVCGAEAEPVAYRFVAISAMTGAAIYEHVDE